jgi:hypothetical protein
MKEPGLREAVLKTGKMFRQMMPIFLGVMLLISLVITAFSDMSLGGVFTGSYLLDPAMGAILGSIALGNPINSYIIGGELLAIGVSMVAVAAFIIAWVTVGVVQFPAESMILGRRFAILRNGLSFLMAIIIAIILAGLLEVLA